VAVGTVRVTSYNFIDNYYPSLLLSSNSATVHVLSTLQLFLTTKSLFYMNGCLYECNKL